MLPKKLLHKLEKRQQENAFRQLRESKDLIDFSSNDYLGFSKSESIFNEAHQYLINHNYIQNGATGSRLLSGNHKLYTIVEQQISAFHHSETALVFNSGYDANLGILSCVPQRNDIILFDEYCHASIRDGINMSHAKAFKFKHNDVKNLEQLIERHSKLDSTSQYDIYVVTESVFSMDGDTPDLKSMSLLCQNHNANLIVDEAHAIGVFGTQGNGLINELQIENKIFARIVTFGKALGAHGAAILCDHDLRNYLINFSKPFIYTTALSPHVLATVKISYDQLAINSDNSSSEIHKLQHNIAFFKSELKRLNLQQLFIYSNSAIQCCIISGNDNVKQISKKLKPFDVKPILSPTVPKEEERLRFCLHAFNTEKEISKVLKLLTTFVKT